MKKTKKENVLDTGKTVGELLIEGLGEYAEELARDKRSAPQKFNFHKVVLDLRPTEYSPELVKKTRAVLGMSQAVFAQFIGVARATVRAWEQGLNTPQPIACRLMDEIRHDPGYWQSRLAKMVAPKKGTVAR